MTSAPGFNPAEGARQRVLPDDWRLLRTPPAPGGWNMACDLKLLELARRERTGFLRVYGWSEPTVSFGRNERTDGVFSPRALGSAGLAAVRRPTGGRALLHHREVTYSLAIPMQDDLRWQQAYQGCNELLLRALHTLGVPARIVETTTTRAVVPVDSGDAASTTPPPPIGELCFSGIAAGELAVGARKIVASSVWRERGAYLQHGSFLVADDQEMLVQAFGDHIDRPEPAAVLSELLPAVGSVANMTDRVEAALHDALGQCGNTRHWSIPADIVPAIDATRARLESPEWLWRR